MRPTRVTRPKHPCVTMSPSSAGHPYSVLLPVGFTLPPLLPGARCALTAPFHPSPKAFRREGGLFSVALSLGSPPPAVSRHRVSVEPGLSSACVSRGRPAVWRGRDALRRPTPSSRRRVRRSFPPHLTAGHWVWCGAVGCEKVPRPIPLRSKPLRPREGGGESVRPLRPSDAPVANAAGTR